MLSNNTTYFFITTIFMVVIFSFCQAPKTPLNGAQLAQGYCASCHAFPDPEILDKTTWKKYVLPRMGQFMGIYQNPQQRDSLLEKGSAADYLKQNNVYPSQATLDDDEWQAIQTFYLEQAPPQLKVDTIATTPSSLFKYRFPDLFLSPPSTTYLSIEAQQISFADANKKAFFQVDEYWKIQKQARVGEALTHVEKEGSDYWLTVMGSFSPTDQDKGYLYRLSSDPKVPSRKVIDQLRRPVHASYEDFNQDGLKDIVICEYGNWTGALSLWIAHKEGIFVRQELINRSGAIATEIIDLNGDGRMDILALF
ncbi:MAG: FG-GAP-like repeat-containing protein, partial [Bacteroidota bacterium]